MDMLINLKQEMLLMILHNTGNLSFNFKTPGEFSRLTFKIKNIYIYFHNTQHFLLRQGRYQSTHKYQQAPARSCSQRIASEKQGQDGYC